MNDLTEMHETQIVERERPLAAEQDLFCPDAIYECDNDLEIPSLRLDMQAKRCTIPFLLFGEQKRTYQMNGTGTLHFYGDDYRFQSVYEHPEKILQHNPENIVEPNFSLFNDMAIAFGIQAVYKKRLVARQMQEKGIRVFVDLNVASKWYRINMVGVPRGWQAYCTRGYSDRLQYLQFEYELAKSWADGNPITMVVYGGGQTVKKFCKEKGLIYVTPMVVVKKRAKALEDIKNTVAFFGQEIKLDVMLSNKEDLFNNQVEDFSMKKIDNKNSKNYSMSE